MTASPRPLFQGLKWESGLDRHESSLVGCGAAAALAWEKVCHDVHLLTDLACQFIEGQQPVRQTVCPNSQGITAPAGWRLGPSCSGSLAAHEVAARSERMSTHRENRARSLNSCRRSLRRHPRLKFSY